MKGVRCSWVDLFKIRQALANGRRGDQSWLERLRCVDHSTVSTWKAALDVVEAVDGKRDLSHVSHFQPTHAREIARTYRRRSKVWDDAIKQEILGWVERCEDEELTVEQLREALAPSVDSPTCNVKDLQELIDAGKTFGTICADPPWQYDNRGTRGAATKCKKDRGGIEVNHGQYPTLTLEEIAALPVGQLAAPDCHLHLWTTNAFLFECPRLFAAWGFTYKSCFVWVKPQMGIGNYWRVSHEFLLLGVRGSARFQDRGLKSWAEVKRDEHSSKPEQVRLMIERASPAPRLELFGRQSYPGWTVWGNEIEKGLFYQGESDEFAGCASGGEWDAN